MGLQWGVKTTSMPADVPNSVARCRLSGADPRRCRRRVWWCHCPCVLGGPQATHPSASEPRRPPSTCGAPPLPSPADGTIWHQLAIEKPRLEKSLGLGKSIQFQCASASYRTSIGVQQLSSTAS